MMKGRSTAVSNGDGSRHVRYDRGEGEPPSVAVATALARFHGEDVTASNIRLYDYVDPEALDALFTPAGGRDRTVEHVRFEIDRATVIVRPESVQVY